MLPLGDAEIQLLLLVQRPQPNPIVLVQLPIVQLGHLPGRCVHLAEPGAFLGHHRRVVGEDVHGETVQALQIPFVGGVFQCPLVVDVGKEVAIFEIAVEVGRVAEILRGHQLALRQRRPRLGLE